MYQIVSATVGDIGISAMSPYFPPKGKRSGRRSRPLMAASALGFILVLAAVVAWCYYYASLHKADLLTTEQLDLNKHGYVIRNQAGVVIFQMQFRYFNLSGFMQDYGKKRLSWIISNLLCICIILGLEP